MKKLRVYLATLPLLAAITAQCGATALAEDEPKPTPAVEWIFLEAIPTATPTPPPPPPVEIREHVHNELEVETLARLLWSSPLRGEEQKTALLWVVLNRVDDQSGLFADSILEAVSVSEFSFYDDDAHLSEANLTIARDVLDAWKSRKEGCWIGRHVPANGLYIRFTGENNRNIEVTAERGGEALVW